MDLGTYRHQRRGEALVVMVSILGVVSLCGLLLLVPGAGRHRDYYPAYGDPYASSYNQPVSLPTLMPTIPAPPEQPSGLVTVRHDTPPPQKVVIINNGNGSVTYVDTRETERWCIFVRDCPP